MVALLMVPLVGMGAFAIDVGALFAERAQLQNGVDGAALAVAASCAKDASACSTGALTTAQSNVDGNASIPRDPVANSPVIDFTNNTVTVTASTDVDHILASVLTGDTSGNVGASGSAEWGVPIAGGLIPVGFGICEFESVEAAGPGEVPEKISIELGVKARADCPNVTDNPGGFGWLDAAGCEVQLDLRDSDLWHLGESGMGGGSSGCSPVKDWCEPWLDTVILSPIFDSFKPVKKSCDEAADTSPNPPKECYHIAKFAAFHLTGGKLTSFNHIDPTAPACKAGCLQGYFVKYVSVDEAFELGDGDPDGLSVVRMIITPGEMADLLD